MSGGGTKAGGGDYLLQFCVPASSPKTSCATALLPDQRRNIATNSSGRLRRLVRPEPSLIQRSSLAEQLDDADDHVDDGPERRQNDNDEGDHFLRAFTRRLEQKLAAEFKKATRIIVAIVG